MTPSQRAAANEAATTRLSRLLTLIPWLSNRPGISFDEAAAGLGITKEQLRSDLNLIFMCGYGQMPDELIEVDADGDHIFLRNVETIERPLRLGLDEAVALMVGLRAMSAVPGMGDTSAIESALAKLEEATGSLGEAAGRVQVDLSDGAEEDTIAGLRSAMANGHRVRLRYLVPSRDETTEREVDPMRLVNLEGHWYLEGWCHRSEAVRLFRLDRIEAFTELDVDGTPPPEAVPRDLDEGLFQPGPHDTLVTLELSREARWVADYYPVESRVDHGDETLEVTLWTAETAWLRRLMLRLGGRARVTAPAEVVAEVRDAAAGALSAYEVG